MRLKVLRDFLMDLQSSKGCLIVSPEQRLSLELKSYDLELSSDESGKLLVYAVGSEQDLEHDVIRAITLQALLMILNRSDDLLQFLTWNGFGNFKTGVDKSEFISIRFTLVDGDTDVKDGIHNLWMDQLIDNPTEEFMWGLKEICSNSRLREKIKLATATTSRPITDFLNKSMFSGTNYWEYLLCLRGCLALGLAHHVLQLRNSVDFGLDNGRRKKRMAVPYTSADVPSDRAEFSHPDICLFLTILAYYYAGLTNAQMEEAIQKLLKLSKVSQEAHYRRWYNQVQDRLSEEERNSINECKKIDLTNRIQFQLLCKTYRYTMETINFWLRNCVFPTDTKQFPGRISASPWDLAATVGTGFSGTNDNSLLYPQQVRQNDPKIDIVLGTNGYMLDRLLQHPMRCEVLSSTTESKDVWKALLDFCIVRKASALIDTGSLLAGTCNSEVAKYLITHKDFDAGFEGVVYFDTTANGGGTWTVLERESCRVMVKELSSIRERDAFVVFDDARTRGADMKLKDDAVGVLTLGPKITKAKVMQGAGRMRKLGVGVCCAEGCSRWDEEVVGLEDEVVMVRDVVKWVMINTKPSIATGFPLWANQGIHYVNQKRDPNNRLVKDDWSLESLYASGLKAVTLYEHVLNKAEEMNGDQDDDDFQAICDRAQVGMDVQIVTVHCNEECEREVQQEQEEEQQQMVAIVAQKAILESTWDYKILPTVSSIQDLAASWSSQSFNVSDPGPRIMPLHSAASQCMSHGFSDIAWHKSNVFGTRHFFETVYLSDNADMDGYMRFCDALVVFPSGDVLALSDKEADGVLDVFLHSGLSAKTCFVNLSAVSTTDNADQSGQSGNDSSKCRMELGASDVKVGMMELVALKLWNGDHDFCISEEPFLRELIPDKKAREAVRRFREKRGLLSNFECSPLERVCKVYELR
ncbi:hypothetical protein HDU76_013577 [Blyttiomyces sp. JEL0837]|nr:hypothetical protein HDU76_013577 [Blyttiomyces sp. JEL0837]